MGMQTVPEDGYSNNDPEYDAWFRRAVQVGLDEANAGLLIPNDQVKAYFKAKREATLRQLELETEA